MAKLEMKVNGSFDAVLNKIEVGILNGSMTTSLKEQSNFEVGGARCSVCVFERFSWLGNNRVSLSVILFQQGEEPIRISAITSGSSRAMFFYGGEEDFLDEVRELLA